LAEVRMFEFCNPISEPAHAADEAAEA